MTWLVFWVCLAALCYIYVGFPSLIALAGWLRNRRVRRHPITPRISLVIAAHNEARGIAQRIENALALDYPTGALEILIASDGSSDATEAIVARYARHGVCLLALPRRGKLPALNEAVAHATGEILVFSDANTLFHHQALRMLAQNFADPSVGGVCGNQVHRREAVSDSSANGEALYWSYDKWLKTLESRSGSIVSSDGAIYAIRRTLYRPPGRADVTDDFAISTAVVEQGYRLVFEPDAVAYEPPAAAAELEFRRKVRIINRGLRGVLLRRRLLNPFRYGAYAWVLFSHKIARRLAPLCLLGLFGTSLVLTSRGRFYGAAAAGQAAFYACACAGYMLRNRKVGGWKALYVPFFFCLANGAALVALVNLLLGQRVESWRPERGATPAPRGAG